MNIHACTVTTDLKHSELVR